MDKSVLALDVPQERERLAVDGAHEVQIFDDVEPPFSHLGFRNVGLRFSEPPSELLLGDAARFARGTHSFEQLAVLRRMSGFQSRWQAKSQPPN